MPFHQPGATDQGEQENQQKYTELPLPQDQITSNQHIQRMIALLFWASCTCYSQTLLLKGGNPELLLQRDRKAPSTHWA